MSNSTISNGSVVKLKSGGPQMTVNFRTAYDGFNCIWFEGNNRMEGNFREESLELIS